MIFFQQFFLDREQDLVVDLYLEGSRLFHVIRTPNHHSGNLITNLAKLCGLETSRDENGLLVIRGEIPSYYDGDNRQMYIFRLGNTKVANIHPDGRVELKASVPAISKTLMSQTKDYRLGIEKTIVKTYIRSECKFRTDLHTHMNGNLPPDILMALGLVRQIRYPLYYIRKLELKCTAEQQALLAKRRTAAEAGLGESALTGRYRDRRIDDLTFINFADLILGNPRDAEENLRKIRNSLTIPKDGQAVFDNLEKVYLYRYVFTRGLPAEDTFSGLNLEQIPSREVRACAERILRDREDERYARNTLYQDLLLWIAREYQRQGIEYAEISDTSLLRAEEVPEKLRQIHEVMPAVTRETGVMLRFLAGIRRVPLTIVKDRVTPADYLAEDLRVLGAIAMDPYVAGSDLIGEETNDVLELRPAIRELVRLAGRECGFVLRMHAGENDSLRDNVANSIRCVTEALSPEQEMPTVRIGHGLYTCNLKSAQGKKLLEEITGRGVTLEFQITSNVRLNNLSTLRNHPLRQYLLAGVGCVQGTDGGALYGTNSIDEELALEKLLGLTQDELMRMAETDREILRRSRDIFARKTAVFRDVCDERDIAEFYRKRLGRAEKPEQKLWQAPDSGMARENLGDRILPLPEGAVPVVIAGGSFNSSNRKASLRESDRKLLDALLDRADPERVFFVVGHTLRGQEGYLVARNRGRFRIFAIVPERLSAAAAEKLRRSGVGIRVSAESSGVALYKCFDEELFSRRPSVLLAFDGNSAALNLIQEAKNSRPKNRIYMNMRSRGLAAKARVLEGYVQPLEDPETVLRELDGLSSEACPARESMVKL